MSEQQKTPESGLAVSAQDLLSIIGLKEVELTVYRGQLEAAVKRIRELELSLAPRTGKA